MRYRVGGTLLGSTWSDARLVAIENHHRIYTVWSLLGSRSVVLDDVLSNEHLLHTIVIATRTQKSLTLSRSLWHAMAAFLVVRRPRCPEKHNKTIRAGHERHLQPLPKEARGHGLRRNRALEERDARDAQHPQQDGAFRRHVDAIPRNLVLQAVNT